MPESRKGSGGRLSRHGCYPVHPLKAGGQRGALPVRGERQQRFRPHRRDQPGSTGSASERWARRPCRLRPDPVRTGSSTTARCARSGSCSVSGGGQRAQQSAQGRCLLPTNSDSLVGPRRVWRRPQPCGTVHRWCRSGRRWLLAGRQNSARFVAAAFQLLGPATRAGPARSKQPAAVPARHRHSTARRAAGRGPGGIRFQRASPIVAQFRRPHPLYRGVAMGSAVHLA